MNIDFHTDPLGHGLRITIDLDPDEDRALGADSGLMVDQLSSVMLALAALRSGLVDPAMAHQAINALAHLDSETTGLRDALLRTWPGSIGDLALAMDAPRRSTAQSRRDAVLAHPPTPNEQWATGPTTPTMATVCHHAPDHCPKPAAFELVIDDVPTGLKVCADHVQPAITKQLDRGADDVRVSRIPGSPTAPTGTVNTATSGTTPMQAGEIRNTNIRTGNAAVDRRADTITGDTEIHDN